MEAGYALVNWASIHMAHGFNTWGQELDLKDYSAQHQRGQTQDRGIWEQILGQVWRKEKSMEDALKETGLHKSNALRLYKAPLTPFLKHALLQYQSMKMRFNTV